VSIFDSSIYHGRVFHKRLKPKQHRLQYGLFYLLLDLDELDKLHRKLRWFSANSFNLFSFYDRDHGPGTNEPLRPWVDRQLAGIGVDLHGGAVKILCLPRIFGYAFNPITVYYCHDKEGRLRAVLYEVSNTFGQRHSYLARIDDPGFDGDSNRLIRHSCDKRFYVSPFMEVAGRYQFSIRRPDDRLLIHIHQTDSAGPVLDAWVKGTKSTLSDRALLRTLTRYPLLTLKVIGGIHWEALQIWAKGIGLKKRPTPPAETVTVIPDQHK
jgi:DUF1365 family protein